LAQVHIMPESENPVPLPRALREDATSHRQELVRDAGGFHRGQARRPQRKALAWIGQGFLRMTTHTPIAIWHLATFSN